MIPHLPLQEDWKNWGPCRAISCPEYKNHINDQDKLAIPINGCINAFIGKNCTFPDNFIPDIEKINFKQNEWMRKWIQNQVQEIKEKTNEAIKLSENKK